MRTARRRPVLPCPAPGISTLSRDPATMTRFSRTSLLSRAFQNFVSTRYAIPALQAICEALKTRLDACSHFWCSRRLPLSIPPLRDVAAGVSRRAEEVTILSYALVRSGGETTSATASRAALGALSQSQVPSCSPARFRGDATAQTRSTTSRRTARLGAMHMRDLGALRLLRHPTLDLYGCAAASQGVRSLEIADTSSVGHS